MTFKKKISLFLRGKMRVGVRFGSYRAAMDSKLERCKECRKIYFCYKGLCSTCFLGMYRRESTQ